MMPKKCAVLVAVTFEVECSHCGEPQPAPDGSGEIWTPSQLIQNTGVQICVSCDAPLIIEHGTKCQIPGSMRNHE